MTIAPRRVTRAPVKFYDPQTSGAQLLLATIERAVVCCPFYASLYSQIDVGSIREDIADLSVLPSVTRDDLVGAGQTAVADPQSVSFIQNTSGTTREFFFLRRSAAERTFVSSFFKSLTESDPVPAGATRDLCLSLDLPTHGTPFEISGGPFPIIQAIISAKHREQRAALPHNAIRSAGDGVEDRRAEGALGAGNDPYSFRAGARI